MTPRFEPGEQIGAYRIERLLGRGGMAEVYLARRGGEPKPFALKVVAPQFAADPGFRRRFEREARLARMVEHPHVVAVHEAGEIGGVLFLATDFVPGVDLGALLSGARRLHPVWVASILGQVAEALDASADLELVHRDVKPENILIEDEAGKPWALLGDFGLSKEVSSASGLTATGQWVGTVDFASPEQLQAGDVDHRTDIYSLGAVLYRALTGEVPFPRRRDVAKVVAHVADPPPRPSRTDPTIPAGFDAIVAKAMAKDPGDRYANGSEMRGEMLDASGDAGLCPPWSVVGSAGPIEGSGSEGARSGPDAPTVA